MRGTQSCGSCGFLKDKNKCKTTMNSCTSPPLQNDSKENNSQVFILLWIFMQNILVSFGGNLLSIYFHRSDFQINDNPSSISPNLWMGIGGIVGGLLILILSQSIDIKNHFWAVRQIQIFGIGLVFALYKVQDYEWGQQYWSSGICSIFFLQGAAESMSQILTPVYVMRTICDRDLNEQVAFLLLVTTQLPIYFSAFLAQLLAINTLFLTIGVGIFGGAFLIVLIFSIFLPKTTQDGKETEKSEYVECWHLQFEGECGWMRPGLTVMALYFLSQESGLRIYDFYGSWSLRLAQAPLLPGLITSAISFFSLLAALLTWTKEKLPYFLVISTGVLSVCAFLNGILLHGLEDGRGIYTYAPVSLYATFTAAHAVGLGSLPAAVGALVTPRSYQLGVLGASGALASGLAGLSRATVPVLVQYLHPFGVFFLHSGLLLIGLVHISLGVLPQLRERSYPPSPPHTPLQEYITQV